MAATQESILSKIIDIAQGQPKVAIFMSGKGSNADAILRNRLSYSSLDFRTVFSDQPQSNAQAIAAEYGLEFEMIQHIKSQESRLVYFQRIAEYLRHKEVKFLIYAGFMKIVPGFFVHEFPGINIHPADLSIIGRDGKPKYRGMDALQMALIDNMGYVASTVHAVDIDVDCGSAITISKHYYVTMEDMRDVASLHERLKIEREHILYPQTLSLLSRGIIEEHCVPLSQNDLENLLQA